MLHSSLSVANSPWFPGCNCQQVVNAAAGKFGLLLQVLVLSLGLALVNAIASRASHSLVLLAEAGHLAADAGAVAIALLAVSLAQRSAQQSGQTQRVEALAALVNGCGLAAIAVAIAVEAWHHWQAPPEGLVSGPMLLVALIGLVVNGFNARRLAAASRGDLNLRSVLLHAIADALSAGGTLLAALAVHFWHWHWLDAVLGLAIAAFMASQALPLARQSWQVWRQTQPLALSAAGFHEIGKTDLQALLSQPRTGAPSLHRRVLSNRRGLQQRSRGSSPADT